MTENPDKAAWAQDDWAWPDSRTVDEVIATGSTADRVALARNRRIGRSALRRLAALGDPGVNPAVRDNWSASEEMRRALDPENPPDPLGTQELIGLLRCHNRVRHPLKILDLPHRLDLDLLVAEHRREPLPPGAAEALIINGDCPRDVVLALLDTRGAQAHNRRWFRPAVRALRMGRVTPDELARHVAPAHRALLLARTVAPALSDSYAGKRFAGRIEPAVRTGLRWNDAEKAVVRSAVRRLLRDTLGVRPETWLAAALLVPGFGGTLPDLTARAAAGAAPPAHEAPPQSGALATLLAQADTAVAVPVVHGLPDSAARALAEAVDDIAPPVLRALAARPAPTG